MFFASDNTGPVPQQVLDALAEVNTGYQSGYGADDYTQKAADMVRDVFEAPEAAVYFVATGTAANSLALACYSNPWDTIFCSPVAHIHEDECNAPEFYSNAKLTLVGDSDKIDPDALRRAILNEEIRGVHGPQRGPVSITQITEKGRAYSLDEIKAVCDVAKEFGLPVHLDGARFANAIQHLGCTPAEMSWKAGVDVVSFGGTKNGLMGVEAVVFFDKAKAWEFELRRKRGAHLFSKHRYLAAQMIGFLRDGLWLDLAQKANERGAQLAQHIRDIPQTELMYEPAANLLFFKMPRYLHRLVMAEGAVYYPWEDLDVGNDDDMVIGRLVCDWSSDAADIDRFAETIQRFAK